jgi:hypothetical protein
LSGCTQFEFLVGMTGGIFPSDPNDVGSFDQHCRKRVPPTALVSLYHNCGQNINAMSLLGNAAVKRLRYRLARLHRRGDRLFLPSSFSQKFSVPDSVIYFYFMQVLV